MDRQEQIAGYKEYLVKLRAGEKRDYYPDLVPDFLCTVLHLGSKILASADKIHPKSKSEQPFYKVRFNIKITETEEPSSAFDLVKEAERLVIVETPFNSWHQKPVLLSERNLEAKLKTPYFQELRAQIEGTYRGSFNHAQNSGNPEIGICFEFEANRDKYGQSKKMVYNVKLRTYVIKRDLQNYLVSGGDDLLLSQDINDISDNLTGSRVKELVNFDLNREDTGLYLGKAYLAMLAAIKTDLERRIPK